MVPIKSTRGILFMAIIFSWIALSAISLLGLVPVDVKTMLAILNPFSALAGVIIKSLLDEMAASQKTVSYPPDLDAEVNIKRKSQNKD